MVPVWENAGRSAERDAVVVSARTSSSWAEQHGVAVALGDGHRSDLVVEESALPGRRTLMRGGCELVLLFPGERVCVVGERTHGLIGEDVVEPVVGEVILQSHVAVFEAGPGLFQHVRGPRHRFLAAVHHHVEVAGSNQLIRQGDGIETR